MLTLPEYQGLRRLKIPLHKWGTSYRVKVPAPSKRLGKLTFVSSLTTRNKEAICKYYKIKLDVLNDAILPREKTQKEEFKQYDNYEVHYLNNSSQEEFISKLEMIMKAQGKAFKLNVAIGYTLIDPTTGFEHVFHESINNTCISERPFVVHGRDDIKSIMNKVSKKSVEDSISFSSSALKIKSIDQFAIYVYYLDASMGDDADAMPDVIKNNHNLMNPRDTRNKCLFHCIAFHFNRDVLPKRLKTHVKAAFQQYCAFKNIKYSTHLYKTFEPIDIMELDILEDCFKSKIEVYTLDVESNSTERFRESSKDYPTTISILMHENHAIYIKDPLKFIGTYKCDKCLMIFPSAVKLKDHRVGKCEQLELKSFPKVPTMFLPKQNEIKGLASSYGLYDLDIYQDHFICFDFEAVLQITNTKIGHSGKTTLTNNHYPCSVSVIDTLTKVTKCFINEDITKLLEDFHQYVIHLSDLILIENKKKFKELISCLDRSHSSVINKLLTKNLPSGDKEVLNELLTKARGKDEDEYIQCLESLSNDTKAKVEAKSSAGFVKKLKQIPLIGFNSGRYDMNLIRNQFFGVIGKDPQVIKANSSYMCISTEDFKMLDITNYLPAGINLDKYLTTYTGGCKCICPHCACSHSEISCDCVDKSKCTRGSKGCDDCKKDKCDCDCTCKCPNKCKSMCIAKIQCTCGLGKGLFPYEYITSFDMLHQTTIPPKEAFDSNFKGTKISDDDYERVKFVWEHYQMKSIMDLLIWYNNLDVKPFMLAIQEHRKFYKRYDLDMFRDAISLPGLAEKVMFQTCLNDLPKVEVIPGEAFEFCPERFNGYKQQDEKKGREFNMTMHKVKIILSRQRYTCRYCKCKLTTETASVDRINNKIGHTNENIVISCVSCNVARGDMDFKRFIHKSNLNLHSNRLIFSIDEEQAHIYELMKQNIVGGPSIIFKRYAEANRTRIRTPDGLFCKKILGEDANALYLWALSQSMPCGRLTTIEAYDGIINDIRDDKIFGFLECDIHVPEHLKEKFSEMCPIFKNVVIPSTEEVIGTHMHQFNQSRGKDRARNGRKLIGSLFGEKILLYTPLIKFYLRHGLIITKTYQFVKAFEAKPFRAFAEQVSDARREGDVDQTKSTIGGIMKDTGNSAFGRMGMDMTKHKIVKYTKNRKDEMKLTNSFLFLSKEQLSNSSEVVMKKRKIKQYNPIHVSIAIYQLAKLRMLEFYYDCIDRYIPRECYEYLEMDTDSAYIAFSEPDPFTNCIRPELKDEFIATKHHWFPRTDTEEHKAYDKRKPGLFKDEWAGNAMVSLSSKNYCCYLPDEKWSVKVSAKGVQKSRNKDVLSPENFKRVIDNKIVLQGTNKGFRVCRESKTMITYEQHKTALNYYYDKRRVLDDGIHTVPLDL